MVDPLYESLCTNELLYSAWLRVKTKHSVGGIDNQSIESYSVTIDRNLQDLLLLLKTGKYIQQPYKEFFIPKNENEKRRLCLLTINDKIIQNAVSLLITPIFEKSFLPVSYGYRASKGSVKAIKKVQHIISKEHNEWIVSCDIDNFFDSIPHDLLFRKLGNFLKSPAIVELLKMFVSMGHINKDHHWRDSSHGLPQGGVVSPMLANFYLYPLDKLMTEKEYGFVRYADDFVILTKTQSSAKCALKDALELLTGHLKLSLNEGACVLPSSAGFEFLGIYFQKGEITLSDRKYSRLLFKLTEASNTGSSFIPEKLKDVLQGIHNFYAKLVPQSILSRLDDDFLTIMQRKAQTKKPGITKIRDYNKDLMKIEFLNHKHNFQKSDYLKKEFLIGFIGKSQIENKTTTITKSVGPIKSTKAVAKRKHEYQKLETAGFDLVLSQPGLIVGRREYKLIVKKNGKVLNEVPLSNLKNITVVSDGIGFSSNVVEACAEHKISIDFLGNDGKPYAILHLADFFEASTGIAQLNGYNNNCCFRLVKSIITGKISNQLNLLKYYGKYYRKINKAYFLRSELAVKEMLKEINLIKKLKEEDLDNFRQQVFAIEGRAASHYWETFGLILITRVPFIGRERQGATDLVNCMLNYGYGILYARIAEVIVKARLNPCLSYLHMPEKNRPSLIYDLIEEFRSQAVDRVVFALIMRHKQLKVEEGLLNKHTKLLLAEKVIDRINTIEIFRNREMHLYEIFQHQANSIGAYLKGENRSYKPYIRKW